MNWQYTPYVLPTVSAAVVAAGLTVYALRYRRRNADSPVLTAFLANTVALTLWTAFSTVKLLSTDPAVKLAAYKLLYFGAAPIGAFGLLFALAYTGRDRWLRPRFVVLLLSAPTLYLLLLFVTPQIVIGGTRLVDTNGLLILRVEDSPAHVWLQLVYNLVLSVVAIAFIATEAYKLGRKYVPQAFLLGIGASAPLLIVLATTARIPPFTVDTVNFVPASAAVTAVAFGVALFRYQLLDLPPIAYTAALEASPDATFVIDTNRRIIHATDRGEQLLAARDSARGDLLSDQFSDITLAIDEADEIRIDENGVDMYLSVRTRKLHHRGKHLGWVILLRDVTTLQEQKQVIKEQNERLTLFNDILRHDIRNDMTVVLGNARILMETIDNREQRSQLETIIRKSDQAVELTRTVQQLMQAMLDDESTVEPIAVRPALTSEVDSLHETDADVRVRDDLPDVRVLADDSITTVFRNLLTNAVRHGGDSPVVTVSITEEAETVVVTVADNGPGIAPERREEVFGRGSKGLRSSGTGIGLYLVETLVSGYGGEVRVDSNEPQGAVFSVRLQRAGREHPQMGGTADNGNLV